MTTPHVRIALAVCSCVLISAVVSPAAGAQRLASTTISASFGPRGLVRLELLDRKDVFQLREDNFEITLAGRRITSERLPAPAIERAAQHVTYHWRSGAVAIDVVYELRPAWRFLSKQVVVASAGDGPAFKVDSLTVWRARFVEAPTDAYVPTSPRPALLTRDYGVALRFTKQRGLLAVVQNPFVVRYQDSNFVSLSYKPGMEWRTSYGAFTSDRALIAPLHLSGRHVATSMTAEWRLEPYEGTEWMDQVEIDAFTGMVRAFLLHEPSRPLNVFVGWCVNDYQIDVATIAGRTEYKRIIDQAAVLGAKHVLFAPTNTALSRRVASADDWSWEHVLWLGLGQQIRRNVWNPQTGTVPPSVQEMLDYAKSRGVGLLAYVYPVVPFSQDSSWLVRRSTAPFPWRASLGSRALQDFLIETLVAFHDRTGITGYAFDHTFLNFDGTSRYAQWYGWRRVMEELRRRIPDIVIDGRQAYQWYGPWSWLAGSYPHPTSTDEQPESFTPFPDLHFDRVSADRQRYTAYRYRLSEFTPNELVPGFIAHQTPRLDSTRNMPSTKVNGDELLSPFRQRDWDYLGWRYSLLSSIATAGWNNVLNMIPARDSAEYASFSEGDKRWFRGWLDWTNVNREYLRHTRSILGQPAIGKVDGTAAMLADSGFVFLFNPNGRRVSMSLALGADLGLTATARYVLREIHPDSGRLLANPGAGFWRGGDTLTLTMGGASAMVLRVERAPTVLREPVLFGVHARVALHGDAIAISDARAPHGTEAEVVIALPPGKQVTSVTVDGSAARFSRTAAGALTTWLRFEGAPFRQMQQVGSYDARGKGGTFSATFTIPKRIFDQLAQRKRAWPIPWTAEDYGTTWLVPERLLLFVQIAEPDVRWQVRLTLNGRPVELRKAYSAIQTSTRSTFTGFYADVSALLPDLEYRVLLELPQLRPGQFQGLFFENVETEYTAKIRQ